MSPNRSLACSAEGGSGIPGPPSAAAALCGYGGGSLSNVTERQQVITDSALCETGHPGYSAPPRYEVFVKDLITPLIAAIGGKPNFSSLTFTINKSNFLYGDFINALLSFLIIAAVVYYLVVVPYTKLMSRRKTETPVEPETRECPYCLSKIPVRATRCALRTALASATALSCGVDSPVVRRAISRRSFSPGNGTSTLKKNRSSCASGSG